MPGLWSSLYSCSGHRPDGSKLRTVVEEEDRAPSIGPGDHQIGTKAIRRRHVSSTHRIKGGGGIFSSEERTGEGKGRNLSEDCGRHRWD